MRMRDVATDIQIDQVAYQLTYASTARKQVSATKMPAPRREHISSGGLRDN